MWTRHSLLDKLPWLLTTLAKRGPALLAGDDKAAMLGATARGRFNVHAKRLPDSYKAGWNNSCIIPSYRSRAPRWTQIQSTQTSAFKFFQPCHYDWIVATRKWLPWNVTYTDSIYIFVRKKHSDPQAGSWHLLPHICKGKISSDKDLALKDQTWGN